MPVRGANHRDPRHGRNGHYLVAEGPVIRDVGVIGSGSLPSPYDLWPRDRFATDAASVPLSL